MFELDELKRAKRHLLDLGVEAQAHDTYEAAKRRGFDRASSCVLALRSSYDKLPA
ncbi:MAG: hypothetical protein QNJ09_08500 [Paracoccaceae bacterium]|nr:hypothetical protein [Paracoccaceae bacterium]